MKRKIPKKKKKNDASKSCLLSLQRWCRVQQVLRCFQRRTYVSSLHLCFLAARRYSRDAVKRCLAAYLGPNAKSAAGAHAQVGQRDPPGRGQVKHFGKSWSAAADLAQISYLHATTDGRTTFKHSRSTVGRGTMHRIMVSGLHRDHRGVCRVRSISKEQQQQRTPGDPHPRGRKLKHRARSQTLMVHILIALVWWDVDFLLRFGHFVLLSISRHELLGHLCM